MSERKWQTIGDSMSEEIFKVDKGTPRGRRSSVRSSDYRLKKALGQAELPDAEINSIIEYVNQLLEMLGMQRIESPMIVPSSVDYRKIAVDYALENERDIVWMKFTKDSGYLGVVATSNDINFDIPASEDEYGKKLNRNTSGIIIHQLGKEWDESFVLVFPLVDIPQDKSRSDIERAIGNHLISEGVPILDYYSHNY